MRTWLFVFKNKKIDRKDTVYGETKMGPEGTMTEKTEAPAIRLPEEFLEKMKRLLGDEYEAFVQSYETKRVQGLRLNTLKGDGKALYELCTGRFGLKPVPWCREGFYYDGHTRPGRHPFHEAGLYYIQEPSAMAVVSLLDPQPGERILDLCAAPGGKTTHIAQRLCGEGLLVSNEIHPARAKILSQNAERMGVRNVVVTNEPPEKLKTRFGEFFDRIVVDAPCSGEGMFRKDELARTEWSEAHVAMCAGRQQKILDDAAEMLKPGGRLVYSTCTFSPEENEMGICRFLDRHQEFSTVCIPKEHQLPGLSHGISKWAEGTMHMGAAEDTFRIWPHRADGEGHYLALLQKKQDAGEKGQTYKENKFWNDPSGIKTVKECLDGILKQQTLPYENLLLFGEQVYLLPPGMPSVKGLKVLRPGLHLGTLKKNRMEPSHALALALKAQEAKVCLNLAADSEELYAYLGGSQIPAASGMKGWVLVCVEGYSIGWGKASAGVLKNHYPKGLRLQGAITQNHEDR